MKKILLATALAAVSLTATEAHWGGFNLRGGLSATGNGTTIKKEDKAQAGDRSILATNIEIAGGWGITVANAVYLGVDAQVANFNIGYVSKVEANDADGKSTTAIKWTPSLQARIGVPLRCALPYIAGGLGYDKEVSVTDKTTLADGKFAWSFRVGSDFKVTENFFVGIYGQFTKAFADKNDTTQIETADSFTTVGFVTGWQF